MRLWHSFYEIVKLPIGVLVFGFLLLGIGNITNPAFTALYFIDQPVVESIVHLFERTGAFIVINFPLIFLLRIVSRKNGSATTVISALTGYAAFQCGTMVVSNGSMPSNVYSSILGISMSKTVPFSVQSTTVYPVQTGMIAMMIVSAITLFQFQRSKKRSAYSFFGFISSPCMAVIMTTVFSALAGAATGFIWPLVYALINKIITFIAADTSNPVNLALYGVTDKILGLLNLGGVFRSNFWYTLSGGTWVNSVSGTSVAGDANIWTAQLASGANMGIAGRFFTPYYLVNLFIVPGMLAGVYSLQTDKLERRRSTLLFILLWLISLLSGISLPMEFVMLVMCPFLFLIYIGSVGLLYAICHCFRIYLGFYTTGTYTMIALPGTLLEFLSYLRNSALQSTLVKIVITGVIAGILFFFIVRSYFKYLAVDLFNTGGKERLLKETLKSVGGLENIKAVSSSYDTLTLALYDSSKINIERLRKMGVYRVLENKAGFAISIGNSATILHKAIDANKRNTIRNVEE